MFFGQLTLDSGFNLDINYVSYQNPNPTNQIKNFRKKLDQLIGGQILANQLKLLNENIPSGTVFENLTLPSKKYSYKDDSFQLSNVEKSYHEDLASIHLAIAQEGKIGNENYKYLLISKNDYCSHTLKYGITRMLTDKGMVDRAKKVSISSGSIRILDRYNIHQVVIDICNESNRDTLQFRQNLSKELKLYFQSKMETELVKAIHNRIFPEDNWYAGIFEEDIFEDELDDSYSYMYRNNKSGDKDNKKLEIVRDIKYFARQNKENYDFILNPFQPKIFAHPKNLRNILKSDTEELAQYMNPQIDENKILEYLDTPEAKYKFYNNIE